MPKLHRQVVLSAILLLASLPALAASGVELSIYQSRSEAGFRSSSNGFAIVHEHRDVLLKAGPQALTLDGFPLHFDPRTLLLRLPGSAAARIDRLRVIGSGKRSSLLEVAIGQLITVRDNRGRVLARGILKQVNRDHSLLIQGAGGRLQQLSGNVQFPQNLRIPPQGERLSLHLATARAGRWPLQLLYRARGIAWQANYLLSLHGTKRCAATLESRASIVNRSGRDYSAAKLVLIAGDVQGQRAGPRPLMALSTSQAVRRDAARQRSLPTQNDLEAFRSYRIARPVDLPATSITELPLYTPAQIRCQKRYQYIAANSWIPSKPDFNPKRTQASHFALRLTLRFDAPENLPGGTLRVYAPDDRGTLQFIGQQVLTATARKQERSLDLGRAFELRGQRQRTRWDLQGQQLTEGLRLTLYNAASHARTVWITQYPNRWRVWTLLQASPQPVQHDTSRLSWKVRIPAHGEAHINYTVRYHGDRS